MLQPRMLFGLNTNVKNNIAYVSDDEILYPVGSVIVIHNYKEESQRYINLPHPNKQISVIAVSLTGKWLAVAEKGDAGEKPRIYVYSLETLTRKTTLGIPFEIHAEEIMCLTFTHDSNYIAALTGGPDYIMYFYNWRSGKIESHTKANNPPSTPGPVTDMAINPKDATIAVFVGVGLFRLVSMSENVWRQYGFQKAQSFSIISVCWLTDDRVLAGCKDGKVMIIQSGDLNGIYDINDITDIRIIATTDSKKDQLKTLSRTFSKQLSMKQIIEKKETIDIRCCTAIRTGFLYSRKPGEIIYFEKNSKISYKKSTIFIIKQDISCQDVNYDSLYGINSIATNIEGTVISCTTNRSQIYWIPLQGHKNDIIEFDTFEESIHHGAVTGLSTCLWKPIFMTCGRFDNSVRIWNYMTSKLLLKQTFIESVFSISLHPTGLYALIGFLDKVRYFLVLIQELHVYREFGIARCQILAFSNNGHLFAAECNHDILVYSSITFQKIASFRGHYQEITSLQWSYNDQIVYSSSINGAIYEWNIEKNARVSDVVIQDMSITGLLALQDMKTICIGADGEMIEIQDAKVVSNRKLQHERVTSFDHITALQNGDKHSLLIASGNGIIIMLNYPIGDEEPEFELFLMHNRPLTGFCVLQGGHSFVSTDIVGNICIWDVKMDTSEGEVAEPFFAEILINVNELEEKNRNLKHLTCRISEMTSEYSFDKKQKESFYSNRINELEETYISQIKALKDRIKTLEREHSMELNRIHLDITQLKQTHTSQMDQMDSNFNAKLLYEFQKYDNFKQNMERMKENYEKKLNETRMLSISENEILKLKSQNEISSLRQQLLELENTHADETARFEHTISEVQQKFNDEIAALKSNNEAEINRRDVTNSKLRTDLGIVKKKLTMLQKEREEIKSIKAASETEYQHFKQKHSNLLNHVAAVKNEMNDVKRHLEETKKQNTKLKETIKELTSLKEDLENEIRELKAYLKERYDKIVSKDEDIFQLKRKIKTEEREKMRLQTVLLQLSGRLRTKDNIIKRGQTSITNLKSQIDNIKYDISLLKDLIQEPAKLKQRVKELYLNYVSKEVHVKTADEQQKSIQ